MDLACKDLADFGLHLVAPSHSEYGGMFADVVRRLAQRVSGGPPVPWQDVEFLQNHRSDGHAAILRNESPSAVVALAFVWTVQMPDGAILNWNSKVTKALPLFFPFRMIKVASAGREKRVGKHGHGRAASRSNRAVN